MILLDTDHVSVLKYPGTERHVRLMGRLDAAAVETIGTTIITVEEQMRGWLAAVARERDPSRQVGAYLELGRLLEFFRGFYLALFDEQAASRLGELRSARVRIGTMDLKIAPSPSPTTRCC